MLLLLFLVFVSFKTGDWKLAGCGLLFPMLVLAPIAFFRVEVDATEIRHRNCSADGKTPAARLAQL